MLEGLGQHRIPVPVAWIAINCEVRITNLDFRNSESRVRVVRTTSSAPKFLPQRCIKVPCHVRLSDRPARHQVRHTVDQLPLTRHALVVGEELVGSEQARAGGEHRHGLAFAEYGFGRN